MSPEPVVTARGLVKHFPQRHGPGLAALDGVDMAISRGATLALVGESGSGKSTLARCLAGFEKPDVGEIHFHADTNGCDPAAQLIFQDAAGSLNPGMRAADIVAEPLLVSRRGNAAERRRRAEELMTTVGLPAAAADRLPHQFSGGQRQRLAIARALAAEPALLILDEALSGLDLSLQAQIANLLAEVQRQRGLAYLFISHDLALACRIADEVAVMQAGRIVERGTPAALLAGPRHPHTRALIAAVPEAPCVI